MPDHRLKWFWLLLAVALKSAFAAVFLWKFVPVHEPHLALEGFWGQLSNDSAGYLQPIDDFLRSGRLADLFGFRMYGYGLPYLGFRLFLGKAAALDALLILQIGASALSVYLLALMAHSLTGREGAFRAVFFGYLLLPFVSHFDVVALTESLTTSALIVSLFYLLRGPEAGNRMRSGVFLACGIFLRPVMAPLALLWVAYVVFVGGGAPRWRRARECAALLLPILVLECTWVVGNRAYHGRWTVLNTATWAPTFTDPHKHTLDLIAFQQAYGGNWYDDWRWYYGSDATTPAPPIPYTTRFDADSIEVLKRDMRSVQRDLFTFEPSTAPQARDSINSVVVRKLRAFTRSIEEERWLTYNVVARARMLRQLMFSSPTSRMFGRYETMNRILLVPRLAVDLVAWALLLATVLAGVLALRDGSEADARLILVLLVIGYFVGVHALAFRMPDTRYLVPVMPLTLVTAAWLQGRLRRPSETSGAE